MELSIINKYNEHESYLKYVNKQIKNRIKTSLKKNYIVFQSPEYSTIQTFNIYKNPNFNANHNVVTEWIVKNIILFLFDKKYSIMHFKVEDNKIIVCVNNPKEIKLYKPLLEFWFNSLDGVEIQITKQYCDWEFK